MTDPTPESAPEHPFTRALRTWEAWSSADTWTRIVAHAREQREALDGLGDLDELTRGPDPLAALRGNREVIEFMTGWQWQAMRAAREQGYGWYAIGQALGLDAEQARRAYLAAIERQELAANALAGLGPLPRHDPRLRDLADDAEPTDGPDPATPHDDA
jgi:hypothetical protein